MKWVINNWNKMFFLSNLSIKNVYRNAAKSIRIFQSRKLSFNFLIVYRHWSSLCQEFSIFYFKFGQFTNTVWTLWQLYQFFIHKKSHFFIFIKNCYKISRHWNQFAGAPFSMCQFEEIVSRKFVITIVRTHRSQM